VSAQSSASFRRRLAALAALVCFAGLTIAVVAFLVRNVAEIALGLAGLFAAVAGSWWALTERNPRRAIGIAGIVIGFALLTTAIVRSFAEGDRIALRVAIALSLLVLMLASARHAAGRELEQVRIDIRAVEPPRRPVLLCNPRSGGGKVEKFGLVELAAQLDVETIMLEPGLDLEQLARDAVARGHDCLGMAGGDGSQALVASIAIEHRLPFVCVSAGTRNHFALDLGLNRNDPRESMFAFRDAVERRVDYATVNGRLFVNNVSLGVYAQIVHEESYRDAKVQTTTQLLPEILGRQAEPFDLQFTMPDGRAVDGAILVMVSNNPYVLGASPDNAQRRRLDSGRLGVFAITTSTGAAAARLMTSSATGLRRRSASWHEFTTTSFEVRSRSGTALAGVDGEALELPAPMRFEIHPLGLTLLVPAGNIEVAERRRAHDVTIRDLVALAAGREPRGQLDA